VRALRAVRERAKAHLALACARRPVLDHGVRAYKRYDRRRGVRQAGAVTYFAFLSLFPLIALGFACLGYVIEWFPEADDDIQRGIGDALPGLVGTGPGEINVDQIADAKNSVGLLGLAGMFWVGTAWVDALREAIRSMFGQDPDGGGNLIVAKLHDVVVLVALGVSLVASVALSSTVTSATGVAVDVLHVDDGALVKTLLRSVAVAMAVCSSAALVAVMFWRLSGVRIPRRRLLQGALLGGLAFEVLKLFATYLVGHTMDNPVYATFAVAVGLLVWINFVSRVTLLAAAWTATRPYQDEPEAGESAAGYSAEASPESADSAAASARA
jgi:membrane protein